MVRYGTGHYGTERYGSVQYVGCVFRFSGHELSAAHCSSSGSPTIYMFVCISICVSVSVFHLALGKNCLHNSELSPIREGKYGPFLSPDLSLEL